MIVPGIPEATSYFWRQNRKTTYDGWPFKDSDKCNAESMAAAGFYVVGDSTEPDLVECFICGKQLDGWESNDDPWNEHAKHQKDCSFVKLNKQNEREWTVDELYDLYKKYEIKKYLEKMRKGIDTLKDQAELLMNELSVHKKSQNKKSID